MNGLVFRKIKSYLFLLRFYLYVIVFFVIRLPYYRLLTKKGFTEKRTDAVFKAVHRWADYTLKAGGSAVYVKGLEKIPSDRPVLFLANHQSYGDIPVLIHALKDFNFGFMLKSTMEGIPFIRDYLEYMSCVTVDQSDIRQAAKAITKAADIIKSGKSLAIFPEGRRSFSNIPEEFKGGAFKIAQKTGVTVVPVCLRNVHLSYECNRHCVTGVNITVTVLDPIETGGLSRAQTAGLLNTVYERIKACAQEQEAEERKNKN